MTKLKVNLDKVYSYEGCLNKMRVQEYESLGKETLLSLIKKIPIDTQFVRQDGERLVAILDGHHTSKALYNLGARVITVDNYGESMGKILKEKLLRLKEIPEIEEEEYLKYMISLNGGKPIPDDLGNCLRRDYKLC